MVKKLIIRLTVLVILFGVSQGPQLIEQYMDHLTGHVEELKFQIGKLKELTGRGEEELRELLSGWVEKAEPKEPALFIFALYERYETLKEDLLFLRETNFWMLPLTFLRHFDRAILEETLVCYRWGFSLTLKSLPFLLLGGLFAALLIYPFQNRMSRLPPA